MDPRFVGFYERELAHVRKMGGEFAARFPKIAGRLGMDAFGCADPYVERMIEAFAFLTARVQLKLSAEQGALTQHLLELLHPGYLAPTPSMAVMQLSPNPREGGLATGVEVPRGAALRSGLGSGQTACEYRTAHAVKLWPLEIVSADYRSNLHELIDVERAAVPSARAALRITLRATRGARLNSLPLEELPLFLRGGGALASALHEQLLSATVARVAQSCARPHTFMHVQRGRLVRPRGFDDADALLPCGPRDFSGYRLLQELFAFPERFLFAELTELAPAMRACDGDEVELVYLFDRADARLEGAVTGEHFALFCTPAINLFPRTGDRVQLSEGDVDHHVVPDRTRPRDFEVHSVTGVQGFDGHGHAVDFLPLYAPSAWRGGRPEGARYAIRREPRALAAGALQPGSGLRAPYVPSETFVSLVDGAHGSHRPGLRQLAVSTLCTNRALPLWLAGGAAGAEFTEQGGAPLAAVRCVAGPTAPRSSAVHGELAWGLLSHLSVDYLALTRRDGEGAAALQGLLRLYASEADPTSQAQIEGVVDVRTRGVVRPLPFPGPLTFGRGSEVTITCDETSLQGTGAFLLGAVLARFFAKYASINAFTETVLRTQQRGEVMRWKAMPGQRSTV
ncbi:MAG: type VI secretion system baseplate subunit TssF [Polyangiales bacterium]